MGIPKNGLFIMENPIKVDDLGAQVLYEPTIPNQPDDMASLQGKALATDLFGTSLHAG